MKTFKFPAPQGDIIVSGPFPMPQEDYDLLMRILEHIAVWLIQPEESDYSI